MQFFKLTPLQSRFVASLAASVIIVIIYLSLNPRSFAYALELESTLNEDHNHHRLMQEPLEPGGPVPDVPWEEEEEGGVQYEPEFPGAVRSIIGRADTAGADTLDNNVAKPMNMQPNSTTYWVFQNSTIFGSHGTVGDGLPSRNRRDTNIPEGLLSGAGLDSNETGEDGQHLLRRQNSNVQAVHISINTCVQPQPDGTNVAPPQLTMYISQSSSNQNPGPNVNDPNQIVAPCDEGYNYTRINATGDVYIGVHAPPLPAGYSSSQYNYKIAASIDAPYYNYNESDSNLYLVDTDSSSALLVTGNLTQDNATDPIYQNWMGQAPHYSLFAFNANDTAVAGMRKSFCGMNKSNLTSTLSMETQMTTLLGLGDKPKQQWMVNKLNGSSTYEGYLAMTGNSTDSGNGVVGGGGTVWAGMKFSTKNESTCRLISNLTFCDRVAYAVPANPDNSTTSIAQAYDDNARTLYQGFNTSLSFIPCNATSTAQYSLARNCTDCARDYKSWLCTVTIPRCEDFSNPTSTYQIRNIGYPFPSSSNSPSNQQPISANPSQYYNMTPADMQRPYLNSSRSAVVNEAFGTVGPYKEVLPCDDVCYEMVKSCPAALGLGCPGGPNQKTSYGFRGQVPLDGGVACNYLGLVQDFTATKNAAIRGLSVEKSLVIAIAAIVGLLVWW